MIELIIGEYLKNLKERDELDYLLPLLLTQMGFRVIKTAQASKGQPEYGNDVAAVGEDIKGDEKKVFIFQVKAGSDRDIDADTFNKKDGIRESLYQTIDVDFSDKSIPKIEELSQKVVLVHNGELKQNFREQFDGFIDKNFQEKEFERWGLFKLSELIKKYLFNEYIFPDVNKLKLFKKSLLNIPENNYNDFYELIEKMLPENFNYTAKKVRKLFSNFSLISLMVYTYSREEDNLEPAKETLTFLILKVWGWILKNNLETKPTVKKEFKKIKEVHYKVLEEYFNKTLPIAKLDKGLYSSFGGPFEEIGYPRRLFKYLGYLIYWFWEEQKTTESDGELKDLKREQLSLLGKVIQDNLYGLKPLFDNHSISIVLLILFLYDNNQYQSIKGVLGQAFENLNLVKVYNERYPEGYNNIDALIQSVASKVKSENYVDNSSSLIQILFELFLLANSKEEYEHYKEFFIEEEIDLQLYLPDQQIKDNEYLLFEKELFEEGYSETGFELNDTFEEFKKKVKNYGYDEIEYRTDKCGLKNLRFLAHFYYKTPVFPNEWRKFV
jgi:hypothetical protein